MIINGLRRYIIINFRKGSIYSNSIYRTINMSTNYRGYVNMMNTMNNSSINKGRVIGKRTRYEYLAGGKVRLKRWKTTGEG